MRSQSGIVFAWTLIGTMSSPLSLSWSYEGVMPMVVSLQLWLVILPHSRPSLYSTDK